MRQNSYSSRSYIPPPSAASAAAPAPVPGVGSHSYVPPASGTAVAAGAPAHSPMASTRVGVPMMQPPMLQTPSRFLGTAGQQGYDPYTVMPAYEGFATAPAYEGFATGYAAPAHSPQPAYTAPAHSPQRTYSQQHDGSYAPTTSPYGGAAAGVASTSHWTTAQVTPQRYLGSPLQAASRVPSNSLPTNSYQTSSASAAWTTYAAVPPLPSAVTPAVTQASTSAYVWQY